MSLPLMGSDTTFERFLQLELPEDYWDLAIEFKAFSRGRKIKDPAQLMQVVMCYCDIDQVLREVAGDFTLLEERIGDTLYPRADLVRPKHSAAIYSLVDQSPHSCRALDMHR